MFQPQAQPQQQQWATQHQYATTPLPNAGQQRLMEFAAIHQEREQRHQEAQRRWRLGQEAHESRPTANDSMQSISNPSLAAVNAHGSLSQIPTMGQTNGLRMNSMLQQDSNDPALPQFGESSEEDSRFDNFLFTIRC